MLRRIALDEAPTVVQDGYLSDLPTSVLTHVLGKLVSDRHGDGAATVAIERFCDALLDGSSGAGEGFVQRMLACGASADALFESFLPRAARHFGELWLEDRLSFTGVTLGMARLTEVYRGLGPAFMRSRRPANPTRRALFALAPGEAHAFGIAIAADYFQRAGWVVRVELAACASELEDIVGSQCFDLVGLSAGSRRFIPVVSDTFGRLRRTARPGTQFALGGALCQLEPDLGEAIGPHLNAYDVKRTLHELEAAP